MSTTCTRRIYLYLSVLWNVKREKRGSECDEETVSHDSSACPKSGFMFMYWHPQIQRERCVWNILIKPSWARGGSWQLVSLGHKEIEINRKCTLTSRFTLHVIYAGDKSQPELKTKYLLLNNLTVCLCVLLELQKHLSRFKVIYGHKNTTLTLLKFLNVAHSKARNQTFSHATIKCKQNTATWILDTTYEYYDCIEMWTSLSAF